jgi:hypothetical protein
MEMNIFDGSWIAPLLGTALGGVIALGSTLFMFSRQRSHEKRNLAGAFAGEIGAILEIVRLRGYVRHLHDAIDSIDKTGQPCSFVVKIRQEYFAVYKKNVHQIGVLDPPLPHNIAKFYTFCFSILEDFETMAQEVHTFSTVDESRKMLSDILALLESVNEIGARIVSQIEKR